MADDEFDIDEYLRQTEVEAERELWLAQNPQFERKPATILEFIGPGYLNQEVGRARIRPGIKKALVDIFGEEVHTNKIAAFEEAMLTGAIGIGKTTFAALALPYMAHWLLCLKDPQDYFSLLPGSKIAIMFMSTSEKQARGVLFSDVFNKIDASPWFQKYYPRNKSIKTYIEFSSKNIFILPGDSKETTFEGYNIIGGVIDEQDSHVITKEKDYADVGYDTITGRMRSRFGKRGFLCLIGQMKKSNGFAMRKYHAFLASKRAYVVRMTIWESLGWDWVGDDELEPYPFLKNCSQNDDGSLNPDGEHDSFFYDIKRKTFIPPGIAALLPDSKTLIEIPMYYYEDFRNKPEKSLKDLAGIPPKVSDPFISRIDKIEACRDRWIMGSFKNEDFSQTSALDLSIYSPVDKVCTRPRFAPWFTNKIILDARRRCLHVDIAYSAQGDALGMAMGHVSHLVTTDDGEEKPYIKIDFVLRIKAAAGNQIMLADVRKIIYEVRDTLRFKLKKVTYDGFESIDSIQQLRRKRFEADKISMDKTRGPYENLRDAIYEDRIEFPPYVTELDPGSSKYAEIVIKELSELQDMGNKIDHPIDGSKDVADSIAGVTDTLMGDSRYQRGVQSQDVTGRHGRPNTDVLAGIDTQAPRLPWDKLQTSSSSPYPASLLSQIPINTGLIIPPHLRPRGSN